MCQAHLFKYREVTGGRNRREGFSDHRGDGLSAQHGDLLRVE
jgi:hypothetical protein